MEFFIDIILPATLRGRLGL